MTAYPIGTIVGNILQHIVIKVVHLSKRGPKLEVLHQDLTEDVKNILKMRMWKWNMKTKTKTRTKTKTKTKTKIKTKRKRKMKRRNNTQQNNETLQHHDNSTNLFHGALTGTIKAKIIEPHSSCMIIVRPS